jgi:hypothetical protein
MLAYTRTSLQKSNEVNVTLAFSYLNQKMPEKFLNGPTRKQ